MLNLTLVKKQYKCDVCGHGFIQAGYLTMHAIIHTGNKTYKKNVYGKGFNRSGNHKIHAIIHTGETT